MVETVVSIKPLLAVLSSAVCVILICLSSKRPNLREFWSFAAGLIKFLIVLSITPVILDGRIMEYTVFTVLPGIDFKFRVDALGLLFATTASFLWIATTAYSVGYMRSLKEHSQTRYYACFAMALSSTIGVAFSANLFTLYLFYEVLSISTYPLIAHHEDAEAFEGGRKYVIYLVGLSKTALLAAIVITYMTTGTLDFKAGGIFTSGMPAFLVTLSFVLFIAGFAKAAIMPLHNWLPSAMVAPTPVSALLHAVAVVKVGVFSVVRIMVSVYGINVLSFFDLGIPTAFFVSFTIVTASIIALTKDDLKARLAYSTISQLSYVILGVALLTPSGITGGILHIANHAFSKITLFFCAGSIYVASRRKKISQLDGIAKKMPITMAAFTIGSLSMIGVPAVAGFTSKWYLAVGSMEAHSPAILFVLFASTVLNAAYFLPIVFRAYFKEPSALDRDFEHIGESPFFVVLPLAVTAVISIVIGVYPDYFLAIVERIF
ncbi:MAG TPA: monovalent cation/H+ antiporter subunit D family protein [Thermodesulfobacteriota bacterium]|nr:monovalent cation/H+ antiporter subunit D family protein [Thermodesulfobacteriota bacterium]